MPRHLYLHTIFCLFSEQATVYADTRGGFHYFGIPVTDEERDMKCEYASYGSTSLLDFPLGGDYGLLPDYSECPKWEQTKKRINIANSIIKITLNGQMFITDVATALALGPYIVEGTSANNI